MFRWFPVSAASYADFETGQYLVVTASHGIYMYAEANAESEHVMVLACGNYAYIDRIDSETGWMQVTCGQFRGWVEGAEGNFAVYAQPNEHSYAKVKQALVLANVLNVFSSPIKTNSNIIDSLPSLLIGTKYLLAKMAKW